MQERIIYPKSRVDLQTFLLYSLKQHNDTLLFARITYINPYNNYKYHEQFEFGCNLRMSYKERGG